MEYSLSNQILYYYKGSVDCMLWSSVHCVSVCLDGMGTSYGRRNFFNEHLGEK